MAACGLGLLAGLTQALVASRLSWWTAAKAEPLALGLLAVALSLMALIGAAALAGSRPCPAERRTALACGMLVPASMCFSIAGWMWLLAGLLLWTASGVLLSAGTRGDLRRVASRRWPPALLAVVGGLQLLRALAAAPALTLLVGVAGGLAVLAACAPLRGRSRLLLVAIGTVPFAALTWTSLTAPLLAVVALGLAAGLTPSPGPRAARAPGRSPAR